MSSMFRAFDRRQPLLTRIGLAHLLLFLVLIPMTLIDERTITGVSIWLKPAKFALAIGTYLLTLAWFLGELRCNRMLIYTVASAVALAMTTEQVAITFQAARETTSHYNFATAFDAAVFRIMGAGVGLNSLAIALALLLFLFHRVTPDRSGYLWGIRLGLLLFLCGSLEGMQMVARGAHTVGMADGGPGVAFFNWSTGAGDLRVAHFLGIHALQALPAAGYLMDRAWLGGGGANEVSKRVGIVAVAAGYGALTYVAFAVASRGSAGVFG